MCLEPKDKSPARLSDFDPNPLVVLGPHREILYANPAVHALGAQDGGKPPEGRKLGEVLNCIHASEPDGCGETPSCLYCGANLAIRAGLQGAPAVHECRIAAKTPHDSTSLEFSVQSRPIEWNGGPAVFCALNDISNEKRRRVLEHTFLHDIANTAGAIQNLSEILLTERKDLDESELTEMLQMVRDSCGIMLDEIRSQQTLLAAESGQLTPTWKLVSITDCVADAAAVAAHFAQASGKKVVPLCPAFGTKFKTDPALLGRVLKNLLKNALEASHDGGVVRLAGAVATGRVEFTVWNAGAMPEAVRLQIFQRSFSTKGVGRGIGTYSVRLLTETYLQGKVSFTSSEQDGTTFSVSIPLDPEMPGTN